MLDPEVQSELEASFSKWMGDMETAQELWRAGAGTYFQGLRVVDPVPYVGESRGARWSQAPSDRPDSRWPALVLPPLPPELNYALRCDCYGGERGQGWELKLQVFDRAGNLCSLRGHAGPESWRDDLAGRWIELPAGQVPAFSGEFGEDFAGL